MAQRSGFAGGAMLFAYRLAKELGVWDVEGMLSAMTWRQFVGWMQYYQEEPFGEERDDLRMAIGWSLIANANRDPKRRPQPFSPRDFMPWSDRGRTPQYKPITDPEEWRSLTMTMRTAYEGSRRQADIDQESAA